MQGIFGVTVPFFALVLCGYWAARSRILPESSIAGLNVFVLYFALPCMLFRFGQNTPLVELLDPAVLAVYGLCGLAVVAGNAVGDETIGGATIHIEPFARLAGSARVGVRLGQNDGSHGGHPLAERSVSSVR